MNHAKVRAVLRQSEQLDVMPSSELEIAKTAFNEFFKSSDLASIDAAFKAYKGKNSWIKEGIQNYLAGCPATARVVMRQLKRGASLSLKEGVGWELEMAFQAIRHPDFAEGIQAMVVDKNYKPTWKHARTKKVQEGGLEELTGSSGGQGHRR